MRGVGLGFTFKRDSHTGNWQARLPLPPRPLCALPCALLCALLCSARAGCARVCGLWPVEPAVLQIWLRLTLPWCDSFVCVFLSCFHSSPLPLAPIPPLPADPCLHRR